MYASQYHCMGINLAIKHIAYSFPIELSNVLINIAILIQLKLDSSIYTYVYIESSKINILLKIWIFEYSKLLQQFKLALYLQNKLMVEELEMNERCP